MVGRKTSNGSPQPAKRPKIVEREMEPGSVSGSAGSLTAEDDASKDDTKDLTIKAPPSPVSPFTARPRRSAAVKPAAAVTVMTSEDGTTSAVATRDSIHERLFAPITEAELKAWKGWSDIESEPVCRKFASLPDTTDGADAYRLSLTLY